jgi:hypothetical protein
VSQESDILDWLEAGNCLTPLDALYKFRCMRLAARVHSLRQRGLNILDRDVTLNGKTYSEYFIPRSRPAYQAPTDQLGMFA